MRRIANPFNVGSNPIAHSIAMNLLCKLFYSILNVLIVESVSKRKGIPTVREDNRQSKERPLYGENL